MSENSVSLVENVGRRPRRAPRGTGRPTVGGPADLRRPSLCQISRDTAFEQETQLEDLTHVLRRGLRHPSTSIRLDRDQPVALEPDEGLANRRLGDAQLLGDAGLDELRAGLELAGDDVVAQPLVDASLEQHDLPRAGSVMHRASYIGPRSRLTPAAPPPRLAAVVSHI